MSVDSRLQILIGSLSSGYYLLLDIYLARDVKDTFNQTYLMMGLETHLGEKSGSLFYQFLR